MTPGADSGLFLRLAKELCSASLLCAKLISYGKKTHLRFRAREVYPTDGSCRLPLIVTSADHPVVPCNAQFRSPRSPLDSAMETAAGSACPGDCAPRGNGPRIAAGLGAAASPQTR